MAWNPVDVIGTGVGIAICIAIILYLNRYRIKFYKIQEATSAAKNRFEGWLSNGATIQYYTT